MVPDSSVNNDNEQLQTFILFGVNKQLGKFVLYGVNKQLGNFVLYGVKKICKFTYGENH